VYWGHDLDLSWSRDVMDYVTIRFATGHFLLVVLWNRVSPPAIFEKFHCKHIEVKTFSIQGHMTSLVK